MKQLLIVSMLLCSLLFSSCAVNNSFKETYVIDYSRYVNEGFFITESNSVSFDYAPVGSVITIVKGGEQVVQTSYQSNAKNTVKDKRQGYSTISHTYSVYDAIDEFVGKCKEMNANGVINFSIRYFTDAKDNLGYEITGMAIKYVKK